MAKAAPVTTVLKTLKSEFGGPDELDEPRPLEQLLLLILSRGADIKKSRSAMRRLQSEYVDWNELRVSGVFEIRKHLKVLGARSIGDKAEQIRELLSTVYERFNKLSLDFLTASNQDAETTRKRERFEFFLGSRSPALAAMMALYGPKKPDVVVGPGVPKVLQRLGWLGTKGATVAAARKALTANVPETELVGAQWRFHLLMEDYCHTRDPRCAECPVSGSCPSSTAKKATKKKAAKTTKPRRPRRRRPRRRRPRRPRRRRPRRSPPRPRPAPGGDGRDRPRFPVSAASRSARAGGHCFSRARRRRRRIDRARE